MSEAETAYAAAREAIARAKRDGAIELRLDSPELRFLVAIPQEIEDLAALQTLGLDDTEVSDLAPLQGLTSLRSLVLDRTHVVDLTPLQPLTALVQLSLDGTLVSDLAPLRGLTALRSLHLDGTRVADLAPLQGLAALELLSLDGTLVSDLAPLQGLTALWALRLDGTRVTDLAPLQGLTVLEQLFLADTQVGDLAPLRDLTALKALSLDNTAQLTDLRATKDLTGLKEPKHGGLSYRKCGACAIDPAGLGRLAEITDYRERTRKTLDYLQSLTDWPPRRTDAIEQAIHGPILDESIADIALIQSHFEAVSPDPPLFDERDKAYDDLVEVLVYGATALSAKTRVDRLGLALIDGFRDYALRVQQDQPNGRLLNYIADSVRTAAADEFLEEALDGFDRGQIAAFLSHHQDFMSAYFPRVPQPAAPEGELAADALAATLPSLVKDAGAAIEAGTKNGIFGASVLAPLAYLKARMEADLKTLTISANPDRLSAAASGLNKTAILVAAYLGRIQGRLLQHARKQREWAADNPIGAVKNMSWAATGVVLMLDKIGPLFSAIWKLIGKAPLPF